MQLKLKKFDPRTIPNDKVCVFIGKRGTGKSTLVTDMLYNKRSIPCGLVMSGTEEGNSHYSNYVPRLFIHNKYSKESLEKLIKRQKKLLKKGIRKGIETFVLMDDCMYDKKFLKDECMREIFLNGRHYKITFMLCMQYCMDLTPDFRTNIDYIFVLRENVIQNRERLYKNFFGIFPSLDIFNQVMTACTENYECLVLDNTSKSNKIEDCVFWYKAKIHSPFKVGAKKFWQIHSSNFNPNYDSDDESEKVKKKNSTKLSIKKLSNT